MVEIFGAKISIIGGIIIVIIFALLFVVLSNKPGIEISCEDKEILEFKSISGFGLMNVLPPPVVCQIEIIVKNESEIICSKKIKSYNKKVIFACEDLKNYEGEIINIDAVFYSPNGITEIGKDDKELIFLK